MTHFTRIIAVFTATVAALTCSTTAAFARAMPVPGPATGPSQYVPPPTTIVTHTSSGLAVWAVVVIAVAALAAGSLLTQAIRSMRRRSSVRGLATA